MARWQHDVTGDKRWQRCHDTTEVGSSPVQLTPVSRDLKRWEMTRYTQQNMEVFRHIHLCRKVWKSACCFCFNSLIMSEEKTTDWAAETPLQTTRLHLCLQRSTLILCSVGQSLLPCRGAWFALFCTKHWVQTITSYSVETSYNLTYSLPYMPPLWPIYLCVSICF